MIPLFPHIRVLDRCHQHSCLFYAGPMDGMRVIVLDCIPVEYVFEQYIPGRKVWFFGTKMNCTVHTYRFHHMEGEEAVFKIFRSIRRPERDEWLRG